MGCGQQGQLPLTCGSGRGRALQGWPLCGRRRCRRGRSPRASGLQAAWLEGPGQAQRLRSEAQAFRSRLRRKSRTKRSGEKSGKGPGRTVAGVLRGSGRTRRLPEAPAASQRVRGAACGRQRAREKRAGVSPMPHGPVPRGRPTTQPRGLQSPCTEGRFGRRLTERGLCWSQLTPHPRRPSCPLRFVPKSQSVKSGSKGKINVRATEETV